MPVRLIDRIGRVQCTSSAIFGTLGEGWSLLMLLYTSRFQSFIRMYHVLVILHRQRPQGSNGGILRRLGLHGLCSPSEGTSPGIHMIAASTVDKVLANMHPSTLLHFFQRLSDPDPKLLRSPSRCACSKSHKSEWGWTSSHFFHESVNWSNSISNDTASYRLHAVRLCTQTQFFPFKENISLVLPSISG